MPKNALIGDDFAASLEANIKRGNKETISPGYRVKFLFTGPYTMSMTSVQAVAMARQLLAAAGLKAALECPGHERGGMLEPCCDRAGEYNGFGSDGPTTFTCPKHCSCHD